MNEQKVHAVIDLGSGTIKFLAGSVQRGKPIVYKSMIKRTSSQGFKNGKIINAKEVAKNIKETLKEIKKTLKINIDSVSLSIGPENMKATKANGKVRVNNEKKIINNDVLKNALDAIATSVDQIEEKIIVNDPLSASVDGVVQDINKLNGLFGEELEVSSLLYSIPRATYEKYKHTLKLAGLDIFNINLSPIAIANELSVDSQGTSIILDIGHHKTYASIFSKGKLAQSHTINWAGKHITYGIDKLMSVNNYGTSTIWKHKYAKLGEKNETVLHVDSYGKKWTVGDLNKIVARNIHKITTQVVEIINQNGLEKEEIDLIITGGSANIINIDKFINHFTKRDVRVYKPTTIGARKPEFTSMLGMLYSTDRYTKQKELAYQPTKSLDISNWFKNHGDNKFINKLKKWVSKKG